MSKRNRNKFRSRETESVASPAPTSPANSGGAMAQHTAEYRVISRDLIRLIILNGIMLAAVFALYYANRQSGFVERLYYQIF